MKRIGLIVIGIGFSFISSAQSFEAQQLLLNWEKLAQLKAILTNMYKGYQAVSKGYNTIRDISQGNFSLHKDFLDNLLQVSSTVKKYKRITDIIACEQRILQEHKRAFAYFISTASFTPDEIKYMGNVYSNLFQQSLKNLDELLMVMTSGNLRMSDDERLHAIDRIFADIQDKLLFLRSFNNSNKVLALQRSKETSEIELSKKLHDIK